MKLNVSSFVFATGLFFCCAPSYTAQSPVAPLTTTPSTTIERLLTQYEQTKDKELLITLEKISEQEQKTAQSKERHHFWFMTIMAALGLIFAFSFVCILFDAWQKRHRQ